MREITRLEDGAYSLLGIFDVHMPTIYGEGKKDFRRLQEEIMRNSPDHTLFTWRKLPDTELANPGVHPVAAGVFLRSSGLLAQRPSVQTKREYNNYANGRATYSCKMFFEIICAHNVNVLSIPIK
jgi:hypothetical protein